MRNRLSNYGKHVALASCLLALGGTFSGCQDDYALDEYKPSWLNTSIYETLKDEGNYKNYLTLIADPDVNSGDSEESSLVQILSRTGSRTVFAATDEAWEKFFESNKQLPPSNPWHYAQSYKQLSKNQKKLLLHTSMLNNAITMEKLSSNSGSDPTPGEYLRRKTNVETVDTVTIVKLEDLPKSYWSVEKQATEEGIKSPEVDQWSRIRNGGLLGYKSIYMVLDSSVSMMVHFTNEYMAKNQITDEDFRIIMGRPRITSDVHIYDAHLDSADIVCENGYLNMTEKPLVPLANMAEVLRTNGQTNIYSHILDRFSVPFQNKTVGNLFAKLYPDDFKEGIDTLYTKRYYSERTFGSSKDKNVVLKKDERGNLFGGSGEALLKFDPGWSGYFPMGSEAEEDMGAMFVPCDQQMLEYFNNGGGRELLNEYTKDPAASYSLGELETLYRDIDQIPLKTIQGILNHGMFNSFTSSVPSKMLRIREAVTLEQVFNDKDTKLTSEGGNINEVLLASNGVIYIMNNVYAPSDFDCVATPAFVRSNCRIMNWAIYSDSKGINKMGLNYYAYLKAMQSRFSFFMPNDQAMMYYYDPSSFTSNYPRMIGFVYNSNKGDFPFEIANSRTVKALMEYDVNTGIVGKAISSRDKLSETDMINRMRQMLEHFTIVHENGVNTINTDEDEYYLSKNGMGMKVIRGTNGEGVIAVKGGFQLENERELDIDNIPDITPGISGCNVIEKGEYKNGWTFTLDAPIIPAARSVFSVLSNIKRGSKGEESEIYDPATSANNPYFEFFKLCQEGTEKLIVGCGLVDESKYNLQTETGRKAYQNAIDKYRTFFDNNAVDYNVQFFNNYRYTVCAPANEAIKGAIAKGLPTWESIEQDYNSHLNEQGTALKTADDSLRIQAKIVYLTNFVRTHFADNSIFADKSTMLDSLTTSSYDNERGVFVKIRIKREANGTETMLKVQDETQDKDNGSWSNTIYDVNGRDVKNIMTCDRVLNTNVKGQAMQGKQVEASSYAVIHLIDGVLNHTKLDSDGRYPTFNNTNDARRYIKKFAIR